MNKDNKPQKYTPKYWVGHNRNTDDVYISTASKNKAEAFGKMLAHVGPVVYDDSSYEMILIEIKEVVGL